MCYCSRQRTVPLRYKKVRNRVQLWVLAAIEHATREEAVYVEQRYGTFAHIWDSSHRTTLMQYVLKAVRARTRLDNLKVHPDSYMYS